MLESILLAAAVLIVVGLLCLFFGGLLKTVPTPMIAAIGAFLAQWAWVIGLAAALLSFVGGFNILGIGGK